MINLTKSYLPPIEKYNAYLQRLWESKWITNRGELLLELEDNICEELNLGNLLFVSNGQVALQLAIKALKITGEVITTPFSFFASISWWGELLNDLSDKIVIVPKRWYKDENAQ